MKFDVVKTNIVNIVADAIVLPANEHLKEGSGTSKAIFEAAGRKALTQACDKIGHCDTGNAIPTYAFELNARFIVHAVVPHWVDGNSGEYDLLSSAYLSALNIADIMGCESIAFPLLASGNNGFDKELAVHIAKESIEQFSGTSLKRVILVVYGDSTEELMKTLGYTVMVIPEKIRIDERKAAHKAKANKLIADGKEVAQKFLEEQLTKALEWLKDENNREKVLQYGIMIAQAALAKGKCNPKKK